MILITGAAGFIGINYIKYLLNRGINNFIVVDKFTYAANKDEFLKLGVHYETVDISNLINLERIFDNYKIDSIINFAAESHVDNSIDDCVPFIVSNIIGTVNLLQLARIYKVNKFLQISTDEVFGEVPAPGKFNEYSNICPRNPYSASKASAEHFVNAFHNTYGLNTLIVNCSNNYGPYQNSEKLIPKIIRNALYDKPIPVYGDGKQIRDWIYVEDACSAIHVVFEKGVFGERYCISGMCETSNIELVKCVLDRLEKPYNLIQYVADRPGHDTRYSTDATKLTNELKWKPSWNFVDGLKETIEWIKNESRI